MNKITKLELGKRPLLLFVLPGILLFTIVVFYTMSGRYISSEDAYVKADKINLSPEVSGKVKAVYVKENAEVKAGQVLYTLDPEPYQIALAKAQAHLAQVKTDLQALKRSYQEKLAEIAMAKTRLIFARIEQKRQSNLAAKHYISASNYDSTKQTYTLAKQQLTALKADLHRLAEALGGSADLPIEKHPNYLMSLAELKQSQLNLRHTQVKAPFSGKVSKLPSLGQYLQAGYPSLALVNNQQFWIEANLTETELTAIKPQQKVRIKVDTYPKEEWLGVVEGISPATGAEYAIIPAQNASGNWVKVVQRIPVRIRLENKANQPALIAGLSAQVKIDTKSS